MNQRIAGCVSRRRDDGIYVDVQISASIGQPLQLPGRARLRLFNRNIVGHTLSTTDLEMVLTPASS
jgi:hypothetical protein